MLFGTNLVAQPGGWRHKHAVRWQVQHESSPSKHGNDSPADSLLPSTSHDRLLLTKQIHNCVAAAIMQEALDQLEAKLLKLHQEVGLHEKLQSLLRTHAAGGPFPQTKVQEAVSAAKM